jgi:hypothetical protein
MSLLFKLLYTGKARSTHHKLALDALLRFKRYDAEEWRNVFLAESDAYLRGAKAPDDDFKDFKNHVLHVEENNWGGAIAKAQEWYDKTVQALRGRQWQDAAYSAGVLSHYVTDPVQPFHTGQSEREMVVHRAAEWSICKSYDELLALLTSELGGYPQVDVAAGDDWLKQLLLSGARLAHTQYDLLIDHYNLEVGTKNPPLGFDREGKLAVARLIGFAIVALAHVLEKAIAEAGVLVPHVVLSLLTVSESMKMAGYALARRKLDASERATLDAMLAEYQKTGKVIETLSDDDKLVRRLHADEVLKMPLAELDKQPIGPIGKSYSGPAPETPKPKKESAPAKLEKTSSDEKPRKNELKRDDLNAPRLAPLPAEADPAPESTSSRRPLTLASLLVDAPSIGPKTAQRFLPLGIRTIGEFLAAQPAAMAQALKVSHITATMLAEWQQQCQLMIDVPRLLVRDAQLLVGVGVTTSDELAQYNARELADHVAAFAKRPEGQRLLRGAAVPELGEIGQWIGAAKKSRLARAA